MKGNPLRSDKRSNSKVRETPKPLSTSQSSKVVGKQQIAPPMYTRNAMEVMNKLSDNYRDIREVNLYFDENKPKRMGKSPSTSNLVSVARPSTPGQKKLSNFDLNTKNPKQKVKSTRRRILTKLEAVIAIQRQFRSYLKVSFY
jgi:hypothetical protein